LWAIYIWLLLPLMKNKIINADHGQIIISDNMVISNQTKPQQLFDYFGDDKVDLNEMKNGYIHYRVHDVDINSTLFSFVLIFYLDRLEMINLGFDRSGDSWDNWSEEKELKREKKYNDWLNDQIGLQRSFDWGDIWARFDIKNGSSNIGLRYS
jgi:hypothetical protein